MSKKNIFFILIIYFISSMFTITAVAEESKQKTVRIAVSDEESILTERVLYTAFKRLGYNVIVSNMGMKTAITSVSNGENDVLAVQIEGIDQFYPNLVQVKESISYVNFAVYAKEGFTKELKSWEDLNGLNVLYNTKNVHIENNIPKSTYKEGINDENKLYQALLEGKGDVIIMPITERMVRVVPEGIKNCGTIQTIESYSFVNNNKSELAVVLEEEYKKMKEDGTFYQIKNNTLPNATNEQVVLHISSYSSEMLWENKLVQGVQNALSADENIIYYNLPLNLKRLTNVEAQYELMNKSIHATFIERSPDIIIVSDNNALEFIMKNYNMLFNEQPVIYCGINNFSPGMIYGYEDYFTGVIEEFSAFDTVSEMLRLFPNTKNIYILNDYTTSGIIYRDLIKEALKPFEGKVNFIYNKNIPIINIFEEISSLGDDTLVLSGAYFRDSMGKYLTEQEFSELLVNTIDNPLFCALSSSVGFGALGGKVVDGYNQGYAAGKLAFDVLNGKTISELKINDSSDKLNVWTFDHKVAQKYGLDVNHLPPEHIAVNKMLSLYESNPFEATVLILLVICSLFLAGLFVIFAVILRRKNNSLLKAQKSLHTAEEMLEKDNEIRRTQIDLYTLLNSVMQPVLVIDLETGKPIFVNDIYVDTFSFETREKALRYGIEDISEEYQSDGEKTVDVIEENHRFIKKEGYLEPTEWRFITRDNKRFVGRVMLRGIRFNEREAYAAIIQDITTDKKQAEMLKNAAKWEREANKLKSLFVVNMSHELRTPMNAIIGFSQIALRKGFEEDASDMFRKINRSANLLLELINDVLDFSKIEANKIEFFIERFELESVLSDALMVAAPRINTKPVELYLKVDDKLPQYILGDRTRIWQVLKNILDNSGKFTNEGKIILEVSLSEQQPDDGKVAIKFTISDTGLGMTKEQVNKLYNPFEQFHNSINTASGTGLGMSITKQLVNLMEGQIQVSSRLNEGTITNITIPFEVPEDSSSIKEYIKNFDLNKKYIIIVGANDFLINIFRVLASGINASFIAVADSKEAVKEIQQLEVDRMGVIVADISVEKELQEWDILKEIKKLLLVPCSGPMRSPSETKEMGYVSSIERPISLAKTAKSIYEFIAEQKAVESEVRHIEFKEASVLLVEDNEINQEVAASMLEIYGIVPVIANNGKEAIELLEEQDFDLVLMDLFMPIMDGHEATKAIRNSDKPYKDVTIIAMTANVVKEEIELCLQNGMNDHIGKPVEFENLLDKLKKWL